MSPTHIRRLINLWPPLLFSGIRVKRIAPDWRSVEVELRLRWWNRNALGTMFGGSLFAMVDAFYPLMLQHNLGRDYAVWVKSAQIRFISPGRKVARATLQLEGDRLEEIRAATEGYSKCLPLFEILITGSDGKPISQVSQQVYVRRRRPEGIAVSDS
jgi:acyl-coenzyme A thioesterase PaaI-like protein